MGKWEKFNFGEPEIADLIMGQSPPSSFYNKDGIGLPFYQGKKEFGKLYPTVQTWCNKPNKIAEPGDVLLSVRAPVGPTNLANETCCIGRGLAAIRPNPKKLATKFLLYYFQNFEVEIASKGQGSTFQAISGKGLRSLEIPLPSLNEQKQIVSKLDALFERIDKAIVLLEENIKHTEALMGSVLDEEFGRLEKAGTPMKSIAEIAKTKSGGTPSRSNKVFWNGNIPWLKSGELNDSFEIDTNNEFITDIGLANSSASLFKKGTLLMAMYGATAGKLGILAMDATCNQAVCSIQNDKNLFDEIYLFFFLLSQRKKIIQESSGGAQPNISKGYIDKIIVPLPDLQEQKELSVKFFKYRKKINLVVSHQSNCINDLKNLKSSLLDMAFKGELITEKEEKAIKYNIEENISIAAEKTIKYGNHPADSVIDNLFSEKKFYEELAVITHLLNIRTNRNYGKTALQKTAFHAKQAKKQKRFKEVEFVNYHYGTFSTEIASSIDDNPYLAPISFGSEKTAYKVKESKLQELVEWMGRPENVKYVKSIENILDVYQDPLIDNDLERMELLNTVYKVVLDKKSSSLEIVRQGMVEWEIKQINFKNKAEKFDRNQTILALNLLRNVEWII